jgi:hypothetical protein
VESMMERALDNGRILMPTASVLIDWWGYSKCNETKTKKFSMNMKILCW